MDSGRIIMDYPCRVSQRAFSLPFSGSSELAMDNIHNHHRGGSHFCSFQFVFASLIDANHNHRGDESSDDGCGGGDSNSGIKAMVIKVESDMEAMKVTTTVR